MSTRSVRWDFQLPRVWSINARERGWLVPAYTLPEGQSERAVLRFVVRAGFSRHLAEELLEDVARAVAWFDSLESAMPVGHPEPTLFHHGGGGITKRGHCPGPGLFPMGFRTTVVGG